MSAELQTPACGFAVGPDVGHTQERLGAQTVFLGGSSGVAPVRLLWDSGSRVSIVRAAPCLSVGELKIMDVTSEDSMHQ